MRDSARMRRRRSPGKTGHCQIKATPEKVYRATFAAEARPEFLKHTIALDENAPEPICVLAVIRMVLFILLERDRVLDLVRHRVDGDGQLEISQCLHHCLVKFRDGLWFQLDRSPSAIAFKDAQLVIDEIKSYLKGGKT